MDIKPVLKVQKAEITDHAVYKKLISLVKSDEQRRILERISEDEARHYQVFKTITGRDCLPDGLKVSFYVFVSRFLGLNFGLKLMESGEAGAQKAYDLLTGVSPEIDGIIRDEERHEKEIIGLIDEERLKYVSSVVLGLNDALVELTGALAGFTLALNNTRLIGAIGLITGLAAAMSMASSEYISTKHEDTEKNPLKASIYTGIAYVVTVLLLVLPYFLISNVFVALGITLLAGFLVMFSFTFYVSLAKDLPLFRRFLEMSGLSLSIAAISFFIGLAVKYVFNVNI